jgi:hypothetical protein
MAAKVEFWKGPRGPRPGQVGPGDFNYLHLRYGGRL